MTRLSLTARVALAAAAGAALAAGAAALARGLRAPEWAALSGGVLLGSLAGGALARLATRPERAAAEALRDGAQSFAENDFGFRVAVERAGALGDVAGIYNRMAEALGRERSEVYQRELMLDSLLQGAPMAVLLLNEKERVVFANQAARRLFGESRRLSGRALAEVLADGPAERRAALLSETDGLFSWPSGPAAGEEIYRVVRREFPVGTQRMRLLVVERITPELRRQEVEVWKKVIRVMSHEMNNSLAPVSSLLHSARTVAARPAQAPRLGEILAAVEERVRHLSGFLDGYARFARLPKPRPAPVDWKTFLASVLPVAPFTLVGEPPAEPGFFDATQLEQVVLNLVKNAREAGSPPEAIEVEVVAAPGGTTLTVRDRGAGMDDETMRKALLPFYSSKEAGTGLGLPLAVEIVEAHGGRLSVERRAGGGIAVTSFLPGPPPSPG